MLADMLTPLIRSRFSRFEDCSSMRTALLLPLIALVVTSMASAGEPSLDLRVGDARLKAEYARTPDERERGLMERTEMPADHGMLFRFDDFRRHCLWMKNTPLPLSAAFMDESGRIVDIIDLEPLSTAIRCSREPGRYALEVNQGWFDRHQSGIGDQVSGIPK
jgi:uncharacterized protein|tara:strand:+ start:309 stop:797 length:489 start_codon:yes stop_codon:yes gene_type:complete